MSPGRKRLELQTMRSIGINIGHVVTVADREGNEVLVFDVTISL